MSDVPDEILREILSSLPVAPLLRFRCVSKSWKGLIEGHRFIKHHLNHSRKTNSNLNIVLDSGHHLYTADFDLLNETNMATFQQLTHPLQSTDSGMETLGSCDGLLVLRNEKDDDTFLWNPWVRRFHKVPFCGIEFSGDNKFSIFIMGFGYDAVSDDYKLIRIVHTHVMHAVNSEVKVYSLKSDSWRTIPDIPYYIDNVSTDGVLANGALHFATRKVSLEPKNLVVAFDLGTEEFSSVPLPKFADDDGVILNAVELGGCLGLNWYHGSKNQVDIWIIKAYGVKESWSILFTSYSFDYFSFMKPLAYSTCGRKVFLGLQDRVLMWYI